MPEPLLTRYRMLKSIDGGVTWKLVGNQDAHNGDSAVSKFFGIPEDGVQVVAVTERSWRPVARKKQVVEKYVAAPVEEAPAVSEDAAEADPTEQPTLIDAIGAVA